MNLSRKLLFLYILLKPFYFWESGLPQISDLVLLAVFVLVLLNSKTKKLQKDVNNNRYFLFFLFFIIVINIIYSLIYSSQKFIIHSSYYLFDFIGIIVFSFILKNDKKTYKSILLAFKLDLLIQLIIFSIGVGRQYSLNRYMGTFNDPNQFAYFCLLSFSYIYILNNKILGQKRNTLIYFLIVCFLIAESASTGMLLGMIVFIIFSSVAMFAKILKNLKHYLKKIIPIIVFIICGFFIYSVFGNTFFTKGGVQSIAIFSRFEEKKDKVNGKGDISLWKERGYDRMLHYPYYLIYGAGEGEFSRFTKAYHQGEFHATLPSILFCYGIIPFIFILIWLFKKIHNQEAVYLSILSTLIIESFTLVNSRQVLFWTIFVLCDALKREGLLKKQRSSYGKQINKC